MTYSIVITTCFIILVILLVQAVSKIARLEATAERDSKKHEEQIANRSRMINKLADDKSSLDRKVKWLESELMDEKQKVRDVNELRGHQRDRMKHLRKALKDAQNELLLVSDLMHIKFTAVLPDGSHVKTLFKLGLGPCGLYVKSLRWTELEDRYLIDQLCTNGERKQFVYYKSEVVGRIEFRHGSAH